MAEGGAGAVDLVLPRLSSYLHRGLGEAEHPGRTILGHAYGGGSQFFAMWVVAAKKP